MPPAKRRKVAAVTTGPASSFPRTQKSIQAWGKISKPQAVRDRAGDKEKGVAKDTVVITSHGSVDSPRKRKRSGSSEPEPQCGPSPRDDDDDDFQDHGGREICHRTDQQSSQLVEQTPTRGARRFLDEIDRQDRQARAQRSPRSHDITISTLCASSSSSPSDGLDDFPPALQELVDLHSSFLTALSLHHAHNGVYAPADLRTLNPNIARVWGKRAVHFEDISRTIGVLDHVCRDGPIKSDEQRLFLSDYGRGKICVEIHGDVKMRAPLGRSIDENAMNSTYRTNLRQLWTTWIQANTDNGFGGDLEIEKIMGFIAHLPSAPVRTSSSLRKMTPLLVKGQRRLEEFKAGMAIKKENRHPGKAECSLKTDKRGAEDRGKSLLDRIRAKQAVQSSLPAPLSAAQQAHQSALDRLEEIVPILHHLSSSARNIHLSALTALEDDCGLQVQASTQARPVLSITLPALVQHMQNSLKNPISGNEAERAIRVLAEDVAPAWVKIATLGRVVAVVMSGAERPTMEKMRKDVKSCRERIRGASQSAI